MQWGILLSGRMPGVEHYANKGELANPQLHRLESLHQQIAQRREAIQCLELPLPPSVLHHTASR